MTDAPAGSSLRARALRLLARREHSRDEIRRRLQAEGAEPAALETLLDELERSGSLSEQRMAEQMVRGAQGRYGSRQVLDRLRSKGIGGEPLAQAAEALKSQELDSARAVWRKRFGRQAGSLQEKAKQARFLAGRGFASEVIRAVLGSEPDESG
jgi:regulatory protein